LFTNAPLKKLNLQERVPPIQVRKFVINRIPIFLDAFGNVIDVEQGQAGASEVLIAQNGSLVYYAIAVNEVFGYFRTQQAPPFRMARCSRPRSKELNSVAAFAAAHGKTFVDPDVIRQFSLTRSLCACRKRGWRESCRS